MFILLRKPGVISAVVFISNPVWFECRVSKILTLLFYEHFLLYCDAFTDYGLEINGHSNVT